MGSTFSSSSSKDEGGSGTKTKDCFVCGDYKKGKRLGSGAFSTVYLGRSKKDNAYYAVKVIKKSGLTEEDLVGLKQEIAILRELNSTMVMALYDVYENAKTYQLVTELVEGGELFERIVEKESYSETEAMSVVRNLISAVGYIHGHGIVHRDLKPENVLLVSQTDDATLKIADFGFAKHVIEDPNTACGTPGFVAPEILKGEKYDAKVDVWSVGVIVYIILCGYPPFYDENQAALFKKIKAGRYSFHKKYWSHISVDVQDLIRSMLTVDASKRVSFTATEPSILDNKWFTAGASANIHRSVHTLREVADLRFEHGHNATGPHKSPGEHDDYDTHIEGRHAA